MPGLFQSLFGGMRSHRRGTSPGPAPFTRKTHEQIYRGTIRSWHEEVDQERGQQLLDYYTGVDKASGIFRAIGGMNVPGLSDFAQGWVSVGALRPNLWTAKPPVPPKPPSKASRRRRTKINLGKLHGLAASLGKSPFAIQAKPKRQGRMPYMTKMPPLGPKTPIRQANRNQTVALNPNIIGGRSSTQVQTSMFPTPGAKTNILASSGAPTQAGAKRRFKTQIANTAAKTGFASSGKTGLGGQGAQTRVGTRMLRDTSVSTDGAKTSMPRQNRRTQLGIGFGGPVKGSPGAGVSAVERGQEPPPRGTVKFRKRLRPHGEPMSEQVERATQTQSSLPRGGSISIMRRADVGVDLADMARSIETPAREGLDGAYWLSIGGIPPQ